MSLAAVAVGAAAADALLSGHEVKEALWRLGEQVATKAAADAPKKTGAAAASIQPQIDEDSRGVFVRVGPDADHFYLVFHEIGTSRMSARPFLRPALDAQYTL